MKMRRSDLAMTPEWAWALLEKGEYGILATVGEDSMPYGIPVSYVVDNGKIYIHSAQEGRKVDNMNFCPNVSFTVIGRTKPVFINYFTAYFESVVVTGKATNIEDEAIKSDILFKLTKKYLPDHLDAAAKTISHLCKRTKIVEITVENISGKAKLPKDENDWQK